nr:FHA domain-containing protein [Fimbriiglobus sp.]
MKVNLVVTAVGPNQGRTIPITGAKFVIGRDPGCQLRPASQAISKQHCAIHLRNGQVWVQDFGSTNGTLVNDLPVTGEMRVNDGDSLKLGPLEFRVQILLLPTPTDGTPLPEKLKPLSAETVKPVAGSKPLSAETVKPVAGSKPLSAETSKSVAAGKPASKTAVKPVAPVPTAPVPIKSASDIDTDTSLQTLSITAPTGGDEDAAAMLLGMEDGPADVPEGSTVMEIPAIDAAGRPIPPKEPEKKSAAAESASAAGDLLKKYFRRT